ncbi:MAG TPA: hypothetical protein VHN79_03380 [Lacunisphaera sp.]|nr:hypothetical protein [Lacunisphaera sp.]
MKTQLWIYAAAGYNVALAVFHLGFWRVFRWKEELPKLHPANRGVVQVMNLMLIAFLLLMGAVQVLNAAEITTTALGRLLMAGLILCWILRAVLQPLFWRGVPAATNAAFVALFLLGAGLHALAIS